MFVANLKRTNNPKQDQTAIQLRPTAITYARTYTYAYRFRSSNKEIEPIVWQIFALMCQQINSWLTYQCPGQ